MPAAALAPAERGFEARETPAGWPARPSPPPMVGGVGCAPVGGFTSRGRAVQFSVSGTRWPLDGDKHDAVVLLVGMCTRGENTRDDVWHSSVWDAAGREAANFRQRE
jgi:hypothetical protein